MTKRLNKFKTLIAFCLPLFLLWGCGIYNFTGGNVGTATSFTVPTFQNYASQSPGSTFEPGLERDFTLALQDRILNQTNLDLTPSNGDLLYEGEIVEYRISPMSATAQQTAAQNRLTMAVKVRFYNKTKEDADFDQRFSFFYDYPAASQLSSVKDEALQVIFERITQDIFNASLADW
ncbi:LptE family protein [uncultured Kriegella sp.]|uniref:LptE family protein n=1 Tax=uncultured Kriegella sp. TaxID=1798910 RepID=UPI0030D80F83|tara:strand:- start:46315 stop:46845 length:531 start_codon:yes stop_codon:yes gene_type:complete